ncbi:hypothetical protein [Pedobacter sp. N23S346]|uniref:hypothetical protein n=1 Tax=Pedobacter sp. N23S346 TaxID=3402750 RepID=UPI003AD6EABC
MPSLHWIGKEKVINHHHDVPFKVLNKHYTFNADEGTMNGFETTVISAVSALQNIVFWHRNLSRGKGFNINGFKSNHYPDFILYTKSERIILLETKGDDRDNSDSQSKCRLGNKWAELAGEKFNYFMVFEQNQIEGAFSINKAIELIKEL